jgi:eukaryotic-like serine/threonine-protein kinase
MDRSGAAPPVEVGRYAMYGQIGAGGMATVHLGRGPGGEIVAIKRLKPHLLAEPEVVKSFLDEARLSACIRHPNVVSMLDVVTHDDEVFLIMEYIEGVSLSSLQRASATGSAAPVPTDLAVAVLSGTLRGLHAAHEAVNETGEPLHLVHRDVSPHNVLVGVDGTARVLDFGVAKALGRQQTTRDGKIKGKLGYMAPEQLSGRGVTRRTDIFASGIVLWELLTGERLFHADDEATTVTRVLMERVRAPSELCPGVPAALDRIVLRALERDPSKRFLSAEDMAAALDEAVAAAATSAVGWWVRSTATDELARRALLLRADGVPPLDRTTSGDTATGITEASTLATPLAAVPRSAPPHRRLRAFAVAFALAAVLSGWGALSVSRTWATHAEPVALPAPQPSVAETASTPPPAPATAALVIPSTSAESPPSKTPARRSAPKSPPTKATASARERLYSRD